MSRPTTLTGSWYALAKKLGGVGPMATALGVSPRTILHWHRGERVPHSLMKNQIDSIARQYGIVLTWKIQRKS